MATISEIKERSVTETPLLLFDCELVSGAVERWSTHGVSFEGHPYDARVLRHNLFEFKTSGEDGVDALARVSLVLANADSHFSQVERSTGWKGSKITVRFVFFDLKQRAAVSESAVLLRGIVEAPDEITESTMRLTANNRLGLQRALLPDVRIEKRCPWRFPVNADQRAEAVHGGERGKYSSLFRCGYSADQGEGTGNLNDGVPFTTCDRTAAACRARGMFSVDGVGRQTARFGGIEFVPPSTVVRSYGEKGWHVSDPVSNEARYNDYIPLVYGTAWYAPPVVFAKNDGNLTRMEVLLGMGEMQSVVKVLVNGMDIPVGRAGVNMTATGWFNVVSLGGRTGGFNLDFADAAGNPLGDPYGSMATLSVVVPNKVSNGRSLPQVEVLVQGMRLDRYGADGSYLGESFTNNPAWVLLDVLRRCGWTREEIDLPSFGRAAEICDELIPARDLHGNDVQIPRFQCNLVVQRRRSAGDVIRGIRNGARMLLTYGIGGRLELRVENTVALQQPVKPSGSNSVEPLDGGWPSYEFGDGTNGFSGILRKENGEPSVRMWSRSTAETANRVSLEFQDAFNEYQQDSLSLMDADDVARAGQEVSLTVPALGVANFNQAARVAGYYLNKAIGGNTYIDLETSVKGVALRPGDLVTVTYLKEGLNRQPFQVLKVAPGANYGTVKISAQIHEDEWYSDDSSLENSRTGRQAGSGTGTPRPLVGKIWDEDGIPQFEIVEKSSESLEGAANSRLSVGFVAPTKPTLSAVGIPVLSLAAEVEPTGGTHGGDQTLYYAVTAVDAFGGEGGVSFTVRAVIPPGTNSNVVTLRELSFSESATAFHVYRGTSPAKLLRIASDQVIADSFTDSGLVAELIAPPDANYDHANFYWRFELLPQCPATTYSADTIGNTTLNMLANEYCGMVARITRGKGAGQERVVVSNTASELTVNPKWDVEPDATSEFAIAESGWRLGAAASSSPVEFEIPSRVGMTVHVSGRAANALDRECAYELSPLTRWWITGGGAAIDADVPGAPVFGVALQGKGTLELMAVAFEDLTNTRTVTSATLTLNYWSELSSPSLVALSAAVGTAGEVIELTAAGGSGSIELVQIDSEVMRIKEVLGGGLRYRVTRGVDCDAEAHAAGAPVYHLSKKVFVVPFPRDFFGSPASGNLSYPIVIPDARIASAELYVTNSKGNSEVSTECYTASVDGGLRTLSGGQYTIQVEGHLAIQTKATPPIVVQEMHAVSDVFAMVNEAPTGAPVEMEVVIGGSQYCLLTIAPGSRYSNVVEGFGRAPLAAGSEITLNILSVGQSAGSTPGRDLTVMIRL
jgi:hypothetical protein